MWKTVDSWKEHFNKISIEERSKFDEETLSNLEGIKRKKSYSKKIDGSKNEYIVVCKLVPHSKCFQKYLSSVFYFQYALLIASETCRLNDSYDEITFSWRNIWRFVFVWCVLFVILKSSRWPFLLLLMEHWSSLKWSEALQISKQWWKSSTLDLKENFGYGERFLSFS